MARRFDYPRRLTIPRVKEARLSLSYSTIQTDSGTIIAASPEQSLAINGAGGITVSGVEGSPDSLIIDGSGIEGVTDHTELTNIGTNTHTQIDTHIADSTLHFTEGSIDHGSITGLSDDDHTQYSLVDGTRAFTGKVTIDGSADDNQLVVQANAAQSNSNPLLRLEKSDGSIVCSFHSDDYTNCFIGYQTGQNNQVNHGASEGIYNLFLGSYAGESNTTGRQNTALGAFALYSNQTGVGNVALGTNALRQYLGNASMAIGFNALMNATGSGNTALGYSAGQNITTGTNNTAVGYFSMSGDTTGFNNVAIGTGCMIANTSGAGETAIGRDALRNNKTGWYNTCVGFQAGKGVSNNSNQHNTFLGNSAGLAITTGSNNVLIGSLVGDNLTTGSNNIIIGYNLDASAVDVSNELNIGNLIKGSISGAYIDIEADRIRFQGSTSSQPMLKRVTTTLQARLADDSDYCNFYGKLFYADYGYMFNGVDAYLIWSDATEIGCLEDGKLLFLNHDWDGFDMLQFGGTTSSEPALKVNGLNLEASLADDSGLTGFHCSEAGVGTSTPDTVLEIETVSGLNKQAVTIDQNDPDSAFIDYQGTTSSGVDTSISLYDTATIEGFVQIEINGVKKWMAYYGDPST